MKNKFEMVIQRLCYEGYLHNAIIKPAKRQITLKDILEAGTQEPRVLEILPGLIVTEPKVIRNLKRDRANHPEIEQAINAIAKKHIHDNFYGIPIQDCMKQVKIIRTIFEHKKRANKSKNLNIRVSGEDIRCLEKLARSLGKSKSETIRYLLKTERFVPSRIRTPPKHF